MTMGHYQDGSPSNGRQGDMFYYRHGDPSSQSGLYIQRALLLRDDEPAKNKETDGLATSRPCSNIVRLTAATRF